MVSLRHAHTHTHMWRTSTTSSRPLPSILVGTRGVPGISQQVGLLVGVLTVGVMTVGAMTVGILTVGVMTVGVMTVGVLTVGSMRRPLMESLIFWDHNVSAVGISDSLGVRHQRFSELGYDSSGIDFQLFRSFFPKSLGTKLPKGCLGSRIIAVPN